ncbi:hypothetical protein M1L60_45800 [Actinoplanes sp. TRM 88003]|uniref:Secreted protein n=1 Tax=Paractinoplanes aksuensis TaxID=2939490 RepID=A0ABT1E6M0_9ACTN|nr:hypothetical protein [Actinoplanes aksuensis]MCO8277911.1 hypothetical protein [Actinoplanes aksuensis]
MKRLLWLGVGLAVGAIVVRKLTQKANEFTPTGIATSVSQSAGGLVESVRSFVDDVRVLAADREEQINKAFAEGELYVNDEDDEDEGGPGGRKGNR